MMGKIPFLQNQILKLIALNNGKFTSTWSSVSPFLIPYTPPATHTQSLSYLMKLIQASKIWLKRVRNVRNSYARWKETDTGMVFLETNNEVKISM